MGRDTWGKPQEGWEQPKALGDFLELCLSSNMQAVGTSCLEVVLS